MLHSVIVTDYQQHVEAADVCTLLLISSITPSMLFQLLIQIQVMEDTEACPLTLIGNNDILITLD